MKNKGGIRFQISCKQPVGILGQSVKPFQAGLLHPDRSSLHGSGTKIKGGSNSQHKAVHPILVRMHPDLLLGRTQSNPDKIRPAELICSVIRSSSSFVNGL